MSRAGEQGHLFMSAGRGPQECAWALAQLLRRLEADATRQHLATIRSPFDLLPCGDPPRPTPE